jgi:cytochrome b561
MGIRGEIMNFTVHIGIGILLILTIIGLLILLRHNSLKSENSEKIYIVTGALQAVHVILYLTGLLDKIAQVNIYIAFGICAVVSIMCILISGWMLLSSSKFKHGIKYLLMFIAILQVISTVVIFLFPD